MNNCKDIPKKIGKQNNSVLSRIRISNTSQFQIHFAESSKGGRGKQSVWPVQAALERRGRIGRGRKKKRSKEEEEEEKGEVDKEEAGGGDEKEKEKQCI